MYLANELPARLHCSSVFSFSLFLWLLLAFEGFLVGQLIGYPPVEISPYLIEDDQLNSSENDLASNCFYQDKFNDHTFPRRWIFPFLTTANSWFIQNRVFSAKSFGVSPTGSISKGCLLSLGNATNDHNVRLSSGSGNSVANRKFSYETFSCGRWFQANSTAIWNVVTSKSNLPTLFANVIVPLLIWWYHWSLRPEWVFL